MSSKKKKAIPDRWTDYTAVGKRIPGTRFVAFKVPLKESLRRLLPDGQSFGPSDLVQILKKDGQELGLIIDLTFTTRYYTPQDLPDMLRYVKIFTAGHDVPDDATILSFKRAVQHFLRDNENNDKLIGVHCTHGLNRTGYLVCRYLIDVDGMEPKKAIKLFNSSRGHSMERENYIKDLKKGCKRSNKGMEKPDTKPVMGCENQNQHDGRPRQSYDASNGRRSQPWQNGRKPHVPFHKKTKTKTKCFDPELHSFSSLLFPNPRPAKKTEKPSFPSQKFKEGQCSSTFPYPAPRKHHKFSDSNEEPRELPAPPPEEPAEPQESHKKRHKHHKKAKKDRSSCGNAEDLQ